MQTRHGSPLTEGVPRTRSFSNTLTPQGALPSLSQTLKGRGEGDGTALSPHVGPNRFTRSWSFQDLQRQHTGLTPHGQHVGIGFTAPVSPYNQLCRQEVHRDDTREKSHAACASLPKGFRSLTTPAGLKVPDLHESLYGCTCQWPIKLTRRADAQGNGAETPRGGTGFYGVDEHNLTIQALQFGHTSCFYPVADHAVPPHGGKGKATPRAGGVTSADETGIQIFITTPRCSPDGMTITHIYLRGDNIGEVLLFQNPLNSARPVSPLRVAGRDEDDERDDGRVPLKLDCDTDPQTGCTQLKVQNPCRCTTALLVVRRVGGSGDRISPARRRNEESTSSALAAVTFSDSPSKYHLLSPAALAPFELAGAEYQSIEQYRSAIGHEGMTMPGDKLAEAMKAKFTKNETCKAALLATGRRPLRYELPEERRKSAVGIQYSSLISACLEQLRAELRAEETRKKSRMHRTCTLQVTDLSVLGFDQFASDVSVPGNIMSMRERIQCPLYLAAIQNDVETVKRNLKVLSQSHPPAVVEAVLRCGVHRGEAAGSTALHAAAKLGHCEMLGLLLSHGADPQIQNNRLSTPLHAAARSGATKCMQLLLDQPSGWATAQVMDCNGSTPLMVAAESRRVEVAQLFFHSPRAKNLIEIVRASDGATLMHIAALRLDIVTLKQLSNHANLATQFAADNESVLHWALKSTSKDEGGDARQRHVGSKLGTAIDLLLDYGAPLFAVTSQGLSCVHLAAESGSEIALSALLRAAGDQWPDLLYGETEDGYTPLMKAAQKNHACAMEMILSRRWARKGSTVSFIHSGWNEMNIMNALVVAAEAGHSDILAEFGTRVQPRAYSSVDWTLSLLLAAQRNNVDIVQFLMDKKVPPNGQLPSDQWKHRDFGDATPLLVAAQSGHHDVVHLLLSQASDALSKFEAQAWFSLRHNTRGPTPLIASIQCWGLSPEGSMHTVDHLLTFARQMDILNINETNLGGEDPWYVISHGGVEIQVDNEAAAAAPRKAFLEHGQEVGVVEVIENQVRIEYPESGYVVLAHPATIAPQDTPLHAAVSSQSQELVAKVLDHFGDEPKMMSFALEQPDKASLTPLLLAASLHLFDICQLLLQKGADPNAKSASLETIFHLIARREGVYDKAIELLSYFTSESVGSLRGGGSMFPRDGVGPMTPHSLGASVMGHGESRSPAALGSALPDTLLLRSNPMEDAPQTALEVACENGAVTVARWILQQFHNYRKHLTKAQVLDIEKNCSQAFEHALSKLPLGVPGASHAGDGISGTQTASMPAPASLHTLRPAKRGTEGEHFIALVNIMCIFGVPIPSSILRKPASSPEGASLLFDGTYLDPLEKLFKLMLQLPPSHFATSHVDPDSQRSPPEFPISVVSPNGNEKLCTTVSRPDSADSRRRFVLPLNQQWAVKDGVPHRTTAGSHEVLVALSRAVKRLRSLSDGAGVVGGDNPHWVLPVQELELLQTTCHEILEYDQTRIRVDFIMTQHGVHIQAQRLDTTGEDVRIRIKKEKRIISKNGLLYMYNTEGDGSLMINQTTDVVWYAFYYVSDLETFSLHQWKGHILDEDGFEFNVDRGWIPLNRSGETTSAEAMFKQVHDMNTLVADPLSCAIYDNFFSNLSRLQPDGSFVLFPCRVLVGDREDSPNAHPPSTATSGLFSQTLMLYIRYLVLMAPDPRPLKELDITGVTLDRSDELMMERWLRVRNGVFSNLSLLRFTSREFGVIEVTPKLGEEATEVRPLSSLLAGNFAMDLKFVTCTSRDASCRVDYNARHDTLQLHSDFSDELKAMNEKTLRKAERDLISLVEEEDLYRFLGLSADELQGHGVRWASLEDVCNGTDDEFNALNLLSQKSEVQDKAWSEMRRIRNVYGELTRDNYSSYFSPERRFDILLNLMSSKRRAKVDQANEVLDFLSTQGRGIQVDLSKFFSSSKSRFIFEHTRGLLEYVKRHKAVRSLHFRNLNFVEEGNTQDVVLQDFIRSNLLRGLTCTSIDFGNDNKHVGEIFLTASTFAPGDEDETEVRSPVMETRRERGVTFRNSRHSRSSMLAKGAQGLLTDTAPSESGLTPLQFFTLEGVNFVVTDTLRAYPLHYLLKMLHDRQQAVEDDGLPGVATEQRSSIVMERRREANRQRKYDLYQSVLLVATKTIMFLNSRDPCYFLKWAKRACDGVTPLRLAIHLQLHDIVRCMIGLQKTQGGLLKRLLTFEPERLEMEHFVDIWGCLERDNEDLLPLHAAIIQVGVVDHDDNVMDAGVAAHGGEIEYAVPRHQRPYQLKLYSTVQHHVLPNPLSRNMSLGTAFSPTWRKSVMSEKFSSFGMLTSDPYDETDDFYHPKGLLEFMQDIRLLHDKKKLVAYVDTSVETDVSTLGIRVIRSIAIAKQLILCGFVERSITVAGNPPPRGCKQYIEIPEISDKSDGSEFSPNRNKTQRLLLSRTWDRTGINERVMRDYPATSLLLALKYAPYVVPTLLKWGDLVELAPGHLEPEWLGIIYLQYRRGFTVSNDYCNSDETMLGKVNWREEESGLNLAHWAAVRDHKRLLERVIVELPDSIYGKGSTTYRTHRLERTALHYGCYSGSLECLNVLLLHLSEKNDGSIGVHALDSEGNTPLHVAASLCHPICTETLLEAGARPYWKNRKSSGGLDPHDICIASLLHHTHKEAEFHQHNLIREWGRDSTILRDQISLMTKDPRIQRKLSLEATKSFLFGALFYMVFLAVLCMVVHSKTSLFEIDGYWRTAGVRSEVLEQEFLYEDSKFFKTLQHVGETEDMFAFLRGPLISQVFYPRMTVEGVPSRQSNFLLGLFHVVGLVRLRQLRVREDTCSRPEWVEEWIPGCYGDFSSSNELTDGIYWGSPHMADQGGSELYTWRSPLYKRYPSRGFVKDLNPTDPEGALDALKAMEAGGWVDLQTRAVFVEFTLYNPNVHHFIFAKVLFEFPEYGGCVASYRLTNLRMETCVPLFPEHKQLNCNSVYDEIIFFLECCLLISVVFLTYDELHDMWVSWQYVKQIYRDEGKRKKKETKDMEAAKIAERYRKKLGQNASHASKELERKKRSWIERCVKYFFNTLAYVWYGVSHYFWREWNLVDLMCVVMFWLVTGARILFITETMRFDPLEMIPQATNNVTELEFFDLWPVAGLARAEKELWACVLVLYFVKLLKHIMILPKIGPVATAITTTIGDSKVLIFFVVFMVIALALMLGIHLLLSESSVEFTTFGSTFLSFLQIVFGQWNYSAFYQSSWLVGPFLFILTLFMANLVLINVFIAVVGNIYEENLQKSVERWSWQIIDEYQYKLTGLRHPRGSGKSKAMVMLSKAVKLCRRLCRKEAAPVFDYREDLQWLAPEFPKRLMRKEAVQRLLKSQQRIQINLAEVNENVFTVNDKVMSTAATLERIHEQLDKLDSSVHQLQTSQEELRRAVSASAGSHANI